MSGTWGEFLRLRGRLSCGSRPRDRGYHDFGQSVSVFDLLGEGYQSGSATWSSDGWRQLRARGRAPPPIPDLRRQIFEALWVRRRTSLTQQLP